jgi:hypothetical protein
MKRVSVLGFSQPKRIPQVPRNKERDGVRARANSTAYRYREKQEVKEREKDGDLQSQTG